MLAVALLMPVEKLPQERAFLSSLAAAAEKKAVQWWGKDQQRFLTMTANYKRWMERAWRAGAPSGVFLKQAVLGFYRLKMYSEASDWLERFQYAGQRETPGLISGFINASRYPELYPKAVVIAALRGGLRVLPVLNREARKDLRPPFVAAVVRALSLIRSERIMPALLSLYGKTKSIALQNEILKAAGSGGSAGVRFLLQQVKKGRTPAFRTAAYVGLAKGGSVQALQYLLQVQTESIPVNGWREVVKALRPLQGAQTAALRFLEKLSKEMPQLSDDLFAAKGTLGLTVNREAVIKNLFDSNVDKRCQAVKIAAGKNNYPLYRDKLLKLAESEKNLRTVMLLVECFKHNKEKKAALIAMDLLRNSQNNRLKALWIPLLGDLKVKRSVPLLKKVLEGDVPGLKMLARQAIKQMTGEKGH